MGYTNFTNNGQPALSDTNLKLMQVELMKLVFPIGSTYITQEDINPSTILEFGTWERLKGKVCLGLDEDDTDFNTIGKTGGEKTHTLTVDETPSHKHDSTLTVAVDTSTPGFGSPIQENEGYTAQYKQLGEYMTYVGGGQPHNNLQPYEVVGYMWIRRA